MTLRNTKKQDDIMKLYETGLYTLTEIGDKMPSFEHKKVSRQRVLQIVKRKLFDNFLKENWDELVEYAEGMTGESYGGREPLLDRETIIEYAREKYNNRKEKKMKQREIKFRFYNKKTKEIVEECDMWWNYIEYLNEDEVIVCQWTSLLDKNKKEIYEGDIVSNGNKNKKYEDIFEIYFDRGEFLAGCKRGIIGGKTLGFWSDNLEVIGNIYENPELLSNQ